MVLFTPEKVTPLWNGQIVLQAGVTYYIENSLAGYIMAEDMGKVESVDVTELENPDSQDVCFIRPGGAGDLVFLTPTLREWKKRYPQDRLHVACMPQFRPVLENNPNVEGVIDYPLTASQAGNMRLVPLENCMEYNPLGLELTAVQCIAHRAGIALESETTEMFLSEEERAAALARWPRTEKKRVVLHCYCSMPTRDWPPEHTKALILGMLDAGLEVMIIGKPGEIQAQAEGIINLCLEEKPVTFRETAAAISTGNLLVGPDSGPLHMAGALGVRGLGLYGPFPWQLRIANQPTLRGLQMNLPCAPCHFHARKALFPDHCPGKKEGVCKALEAITPDRVMREIKKIIG